ncbi:hypothetical protein P262_03372 [Cronobacter malonaticus]|uniref:Uncharacterized protein n=1 Tax=Cronobacter malonaticus TaxID=413503 RepID=V5U0T2_9ENTR|nr:hypothetical protein P262_03372 [Cronobacter malonaticus]CCJ96414.1 hypothetical protein BN131_4087 [Cronobacter malonaticus 681]
MLANLHIFFILSPCFAVKLAATLVMPHITTILPHLTPLQERLAAP